MALFNLFKKKQNNQQASQKFEQTRNANGAKKITKDKYEDLLLSAIDLLCDDVSTKKDAKSLILSKGYSEHQADIIAEKADAMYQKHFANK